MTHISKSSEKITLIGAGLAGSLLSIYLAKRGFSVKIFERRPDMRKVQIDGGRSINLALSERGIHALDDIGLRKKIMDIAIPMKGRLMHSVNGELSYHRYGRKENEYINSVSRADLNKHLMDEAEKLGVQIHFHEKCTGMDFRSGELFLHNETSGEDSIHRPQVVIATDGSASAVRTDMLKVGRFNFSQNYLEHGYKELSIPPAPDSNFLMEKNALHIWPRGKYMLIALPNLDGSFTCTLFFPFEGKPSFATLTRQQEVLDLFKQQFPDALPLMPTLLDDFFTNPTGNLVTIQCQPWHIEAQACLLGDAAHAIVPFFGQGMNCAFEDCTVLNELLENYGSDWGKIFAEFERLRKSNADAISEMALENYFEMRDHVADPQFLLRKQIEFKLEERYPNRFIPKYSMVSFHHIPYSIALSRGKIQEQILRELCQDINEASELDWEKADALIEQMLDRFVEI